ncbi:MAG: DUF3078 domain-containing protein [Bacteroidia bacterium]
MLLFLTLVIRCHAGNGDTTDTRKHKFTDNFTHTTNLSASYTHYTNWKYDGNNNYSFLARSNINFDSTSEKWETHSRFAFELGYMKFIDSSWYKNSDCLDLAFDFTRNNSRKIENSFSFFFTSQLLSVYENFQTDVGTIEKRWVSGFGNPMNVELGYGTTFKFWQNCRIMLTYVTLKTNTLPIGESITAPNENDIIYNNTLITSEYGIGLQTSIRKKFGQRFRWENNSRAFANAINRSKFDIDFRNRLIIKLFKYLDLILDNRIRYTPYPPYKFQFRNELLLAFTYEKI